MISASSIPSGGPGSGGGGMEVLGALASLIIPGVAKALPELEEGLRTGRGLGGMRGRNERYVT